MADNKTVLTLSQIPDSSEIAQDWSESKKRISITTIAAAALLAASISVWAQTQSPWVQVSSNTSGSVSSGPKGFWQMVTFNGTQVSVAELAKKLEGMSPDEKKKAIDGMSDATADAYEKYLEDINTGKQWMNNAKLKNQAAVINEWKKIDAGTAALIESFAAKVPEMVDGYETLVQRGGKLRGDDKKLLKEILTYGKPPSLMPRVEKLLNNPSNFA